MVAYQTSQPDVTCGYINGTQAVNDAYTKQSMVEHFNEGATLCIHCVVVDPDVQGQGIGQRMMAAYLEHIQSLAKVLKVWVQFGRSIKRRARQRPLV
jgi:GNAT superfamily N-acetyltransferase